MTADNTWQEEARNLPPPTPAEIEDYADGVVHHRLNCGVEVFFDVKQQRWERVRHLGPGKNS